jgi:hypothetical protein
MSTGLLGRVSRPTLYRELDRAGYKFLPVAKKGVLLPRDYQKRLEFCKNMLKKLSSFWTDTVAFYLDCVTFTHKYHPFASSCSPRKKIWRKPGERLKYTGKGHHEGTEGRSLKFVVAISHGAGVVMFHQFKKMTGSWYSKFIKKVFPQAFLLCRKRRIFVQDNCPCQNSLEAKRALKSIAASQLPIPPRSPDLNPPENIFNLTKLRLTRDAYQKKIMFETPSQFITRVRDTLDTVVREHGNSTIESMPRRIKEVSL